MNNIPSPVARSRSNKAMGQAMEFRVWPELIQQSCGLLHTFLPLLDRGLDAAIHRLTDDVYIPIQVKGTDRIVASSIEITIHGYNFVDDKALIIAGLLTEDGLGPTLLVLDEGTFKRLAAHTVVDGVDVYSAHFATKPTAANRWRPYLVPRERLAARLLKTDPPLPAIETLSIDLGLEPRDRHNLWLGFSANRRLYGVWPRTRSLISFDHFRTLSGWRFWPWTT